MPVITPTIGRKVWYWPDSRDPQFTMYDTQVPCDATVIFPVDDHSVNLRITDHDGNTIIRAGVTLHQGALEDRPGGSCATWMPYQQSQAAKAA